MADVPPAVYNSHAMNLEQKLEELKKRDRLAEQGGGEERRAKMRKEGKMTARERIAFLLDEGTFEETDKLVTHQGHDFAMQEQKYYGDGFVTGYGRIDGRLVATDLSLTTDTVFAGWFAAHDPSGALQHGHITGLLAPYS